MSYKLDISNYESIMIKLSKFEITKVTPSDCKDTGIRSFQFIDKDTGIRLFQFIDKDTGIRSFQFIDKDTGIRSFQFIDKDSKNFPTRDKTSQFPIKNVIKRPFFNRIWFFNVSC